MCGFRIDGLGHETVVLQKVDNHVPLTTVANQVTSKVINKSIIQRLIGVLNRKFKIIITLVQLVPEEQIGLSKFHT